LRSCPRGSRRADYSRGILSFPSNVTQEAPPGVGKAHEGRPAVGGIWAPL
jgi:hypothetical protein